MRTGVAIAVALAGLLAAPAVAKEGVVAKLVHSETAGKTMTVTWRLVDADGHRFGAGGIYLRVTPCRGKILRIDATETGDGYRARFTLPRRGLRTLKVGLVGWRIRGDERERADAVFPFGPPQRRRCR